MTDNFNLAIAFTLPEEGGYVDNPADPGGATNRGITQATYDSWRDIQKQERRPVSFITDVEVTAIYQGLYWTPARCDRLPSLLAIAHFDWCVNHGIQGSIKTLQQALGFAGADVDGVAGVHTFMAVETCDVAKTVTAYNNIRRQWYHDRVTARPDQGVFLKGWLARCDRLDAFIAKQENAS